MLLKRLAVVGAAVGLAVSLNTTPAGAIPRSTFFESAMPDRLCLDYRADYGPYAFGCNKTAYQWWYWDDDYEVTALRQKATRLCLTLRNGVLTMKPCNADDDAAMWFVSSDPGAGSTIMNAVSRKCLARMPYDGKKHPVSTSTCTGGPSQRWHWWEG
ncbi:hypothetical protein UK15_18650 [Streptomyces variegatus]|uniref:Ricin B lectin domain-containing protein n=1 Tax=Streptomyces variegatus TaxID=284040 RepID=A0A0M2GKN3_9ACTN|nr:MULTISPECIES: RICIN domain-containing protein [Streptomyces]KJK38264.1 hypothetical protein UK15_18650 [Streptomyces variegatus]